MGYVINLGATKGGRALGYTWRYENAAGAELEAAGPREEFPTQADAESWVGETWRDLLSAGIDQVTLLEDGRVVYGPMSLHPVD